LGKRKLRKENGNAWLKMVNGGGVWKLRERNGE